MLAGAAEHDPDGDRRKPFAAEWLGALAPGTTRSASQMPRETSSSDQLRQGRPSRRGIRETVQGAPTLQPISAGWRKAGEQCVGGLQRCPRSARGHLRVISQKYRENAFAVPWFRALDGPF